jgi:hypothetical protein
MISKAALSSFDIPGLCKTVFPPLSRAAAQARCMALLDAGAIIIPFVSDGEIVTCIK